MSDTGLLLGLVPLEWRGQAGFMGAFGWGLGVLVLHIGALVRGGAASKGFLGFGLCGSHMFLHLSSSAPYHAAVLFLCGFILSTACERRGALPIDEDFCRVRFVKQSRPRKEGRLILCPPFIRRKLPRKLSIHPRLGTKQGLFPFLICIK